MDDQQQCLLSPHHATYLGVCYEGENFTIGISNPSNPQPVTFHVSAPEPDSFWLLALGMAVLATKLWKYRAHVH